MTSRSRSGVRGVVAVLAAVGLLAGCTPPTSPELADNSIQDDEEASADELAQLRADAGIDPCPPSDLGVAPVAGGLPDVTLQCLGGGEAVRLAGLSGQPVVLNLWAQYCEPCREEMPYFQALHEQLGTEVLVLGVDFLDPQPAVAIAFADEVGATYPQVADPDQELRGSLGVSALPMTVLVDETGQVAARLPVVIESEQRLAQLLAEHLDVGWDPA